MGRRHFRVPAPRLNHPDRMSHPSAGGRGSSPHPPARQEPRPPHGGPIRGGPRRLPSLHPPARQELRPPYGGAIRGARLLPSLHPPARQEPRPPYGGPIRGGRGSCRACTRRLGRSLALRLGRSLALPAVAQSLNGHGNDRCVGQNGEPGCVVSSAVVTGQLPNSILLSSQSRVIGEGEAPAEPEGRVSAASPASPSHSGRIRDHKVVTRCCHQRLGHDTRTQPSWGPVAAGSGVSVFQSEASDWRNLGRPSCSQPGGLRGLRRRRLVIGPGKSAGSEVATRGRWTGGNHGRGRVETACADRRRKTAVSQCECRRRRPFRSSTRNGG